MSWGPAHAICLGACGALFASAPAAAAPKPISGTLSAPGYTVIALADNGKGKTSKASRRFSVRPPAERVTLQLRRRDGVYFGPIVVSTSRKGKRAIFGVKAGAKLGRIKIDARKGYATVTRMPKKQIDTRHWATAKNGVPVGADKFGLVRSRVARSKAPPGDLDADGVPNPLDIDDNGNLVIDRYEPSGAGAAAARSGSVTAAQTGLQLYVVVLAVNAADRSVRVRICGNDVEATGTWPANTPLPEVGKSYLVEGTGNPQNGQILSVSGPLDVGCPAIAFLPGVTPGLILTLKDTVNANAGAVTLSQLNDTLVQRGFLWIGASLKSNVKIELDCGGTSGHSGLSYCTRGGTGRVIPGLVSGTPPRSWPIAFPDAADPNGNGFGDLGSLDGSPGGMACTQPCVDAFLSPGATTDQIGTGDVLNWHITLNGVKSQFPTTLPDVYATVPALVSYHDGAGNSGTVTYPVPAPFVGSGPDFLGPFQGPYQGFPVAPCPTGAPAPCVPGDVVVTLEFWRPQRRAIAGVEQGEWTDIGGLLYTTAVGDEGSPPVPSCLGDTVSTNDPSLTPATFIGRVGSGAAGVRDTARDQPANPKNTLSFSVDLTRCFQPSLANVRGPTWDPGESESVSLSASAVNSANAGANFAVQQLLFTMK